MRNDVYLHSKIKRMKKLTALFTEHPSYLKWGVERIAKRVSLKERTVKTFLKSDFYRTIKREYLSSLK